MSLQLGKLEKTKVLTEVTQSCRHGIGSESLEYMCVIIAPFYTTFRILGDTTLSAAYVILPVCHNTFFPSDHHTCTSTMDRKHHLKSEDPTG